MGREWNLVDFRDLYKDPSRNGLTKPSRVRGTGTKFVNMKEIFAYDRMLNIDCERAPLTEKEKQSSLLEPLDLLFARQSLVLEGAGKCSIFLGDDEPAAFESHLIRVRIDHKLADPYYLYSFFKSPQGRVCIYAIAEQGAGASGIRGSDLGLVLVPLPPLPEQKAIAHILGSLDDKIELNRRMNATLEGMAQALFKSWFVDFDPVIDNALVAGNPIPEELAARAETRRKALGTRRFSSVINESENKSAAAATPSQFHKLFPAAFQKTEEMGWIPEGWEVSAIGDEVIAVGGGTPSTKNELFWNGNHSFCTPKDMSKLSSIVLSDTERHLTDLGAHKVSSGILPKGTLLMSSRAPIGYLAISENPVTVNQGIIALLKNEKYQPMFLMSWLRSNMEKIVERANGSTFLEISKKNFKPIPFLKPSKDAVSLFNAQAESIHLKIVICANNTSHITSFRDTLLPKLISGELRIEDAGKLMLENQ